MTTANVQIVLPGTRVDYHGSIYERHGEMTVEGFHAPEGEPLHEGDVIRYVLRYGPRPTQRLSNVRPESFYVLSETTRLHTWVREIKDRILR